MRTLFITLVAIALLTSCSKKQPIVYENDTEPHEWGATTMLKERPNAHSGKSVSVIDSVNIYSFGFGKTIKDISPERIKWVTFSYWAYVNSAKAKAKTVFCINLEGKNIDWRGPPLQDKVKELNTWVKVSETFLMPRVVDPRSSLSLYVLNDSKEEILIDDFQVIFE